MAETWLLNESIDAPNNEHTWNANFISNGIAYTKLTWSDAPRQVLKYDSTVVYKEAPLHSWLDQAYRTISFDAAPTSDLLTFLQANGVKQINPANKVVVNGETILDLTQDSVTPSSLLKGITAHDKSGAQITGTMEASAGGDYNIAATTNADGTQNLAITDAAGGGSGGSGETGTTSLSVGTIGGIGKPLLCSWQTDSGWMYTTQFNTDSFFTLPNVLIGGYVVFSVDPTTSVRFSGRARNGIEVIDPVGLDSTADEYKVTLIAKVTAASPSLDIGIYNY